MLVGGTNPYHRRMRLPVDFLAVSEYLHLAIDSPIVYSPVQDVIGVFYLRNA